ncbi:MAG: Lrp/AsnC family transcriptional regulator [Geminicoccaceae bacterium]|nr:Lrp/AsnC family transcriptional regulator [Geminicoccaceae bacterium]
MDAIDRRLVNGLQGGFPIEERPFAAVGARFDLSEDEAVARLKALREGGVLSRFGPMYDAERMGGAVTLCAMRVPEERFDEVADAVNAFAEVAHNYARAHALNMWFVLAVGDPAEIPRVIGRIEWATGLDVLDLPKLDEYFLDLRLSA